MRKSCKRIICVLLCAIISFSGAGAFAANAAEGQQPRASAVAPAHLSACANDDGFDIYSPANILFTNVGYRYGPSIIKNSDGSRDIFLAAPGPRGEWDWIMHRHFDENGKNTNGEKAALQPNPGSKDTFSTCDPGVVFFGGYYYIGYTSTDNVGQVENNVFVARSKNAGGPYEKWNGSGWGGNPKAIVEYTGEKNRFGAGEPSFVLMGDKLFMYYTYASASGDVKLAVADATNENWPATLEDNGVVFADREEGTDSVDVKYIDAYKKFVAICTAKRMSENSSVQLYESDNGVDFTLFADLKTNIAAYCHNAGIEGNRAGHIENPESILIGYAYGKGWGAWSLRLQTIKISAADKVDLSDSKNENQKLNNGFDLMFLRREFTGITTAKRIYNEPLSGGDFRVAFRKVNKYTFKFPLSGDVSISGFDESIISVSGKKITPLKKGSTLATAEWNGCTTVFLINIT